MWVIKHFEGLTGFQHNATETSEANGAVIRDTIKYCKRLEPHSLLADPEQTSNDANGYQTRDRDIFVTFGDEQERGKPQKFDKNQELEICEGFQDDGETRFSSEVEDTPISKAVSQKDASSNTGLKTVLREDKILKLLPREIRKRNAADSEKELDRPLGNQMSEDNKQGEMNEEADDDKHGKEGRRIRAAQYNQITNTIVW